MDNSDLRIIADEIVRQSVRAVLPDRGVELALSEAVFPERVILIGVGKSAWRMCRRAYDRLGSRILRGVCITKYGHSAGPIGDLEIIEAGHPLPDENSVLGAKAALSAVQGLTSSDTVLFLLSGGGSALFEYPFIPLARLGEITDALLSCGADISEINLIRKRLSRVKAGRFGLACAPARVFAVIQSDVLGNRADTIASGPVSPDLSVCEDALAVVKKYGLGLSAEELSYINTETPKEVPNAEAVITGSVSALCRAACDACRSRGFPPVLLTDCMTDIARDAGHRLGALARERAGNGKCALIMGGETVVKLTGKGLGGRNQELALAAAEEISGLSHVAVFSVGSDGTDGPTDAAGGYADGSTLSRLSEKGITLSEVFAENDSYHALRAVDGLIITGPTGTNVNDVAVALIEE